MLIRLLALTIALFSTAKWAGGADPAPALETVQIPSTADGQPQPVRHWGPESARETARPMLVQLHSWSGDYTQDRTPWLLEAVQRDWVFIQPNFRGANDDPQACGSPLAMQDVLDAVEWALKAYKVDTTRIYLAGVSGGGHMTLQMAAHHPERFSAASAWASPTDLFEWHRFHSRGGRPARYAQMIEACCGGAPGMSDAVDAQYKARSPVFHLAGAAGLPLDICTGVKDGKTGSVPIHHSLRAYNTAAVAQGGEAIPETTMDELWAQGRLSAPLACDTVTDPTFEREILLRRTAGAARVTIFEGTHEGLPTAACEWLARQSRETRTAE